MNPITVGITGGTGFVGSHISRTLTAQGHKVVIFSRKARPSKGNINYATWNPDAKEIDTNALSGLQSIINLAGAAVVDKRWTEARKAEITRSRVDATYFLHEQIAQHAPACKTYVASSATGFYGPDRPGQAPFTEADPPYTDFLAMVCRRWEEATFSAKDRYTTTTAFRTGIVLGPDGGAYPEFAGPMKWGIMPILGGGRQIVSWIHIDDLAQLYIDAAISGTYNGVYNAVAPTPVSHSKLMHTIARVKGGLKIPAPVPAFVLQIMLGDASVEVLKSCTVSSAKTQAQGFSFRYPEAEEAIKAIAETKA
jgi:uncharacterized protein (TIGR01777 family)